jgi:xylulose-5-phosphate/fructose-6-phosphate phosphoketolase
VGYQMVGLTAVPLPLAATDEAEFKLLEDWLKSYKPDEIFSSADSADSAVHDATKGAKALINNKALRIIPNDQEKRMGMVKWTYSAFKELETPDWKEYATEQGKEMSNMKA